jgi:methyl-accepting chemotaxis protein
MSNFVVNIKLNVVFVKNVSKIYFKKISPYSTIVIGKLTYYYFFLEESVMKTIRTKLMLGFLSILLLLILIGTGSYLGISKINEEAEELIKEDIELLAATDRLSFNIAQRIATARGYLLFDSTDYKELFLDYTEQSKAIQDHVLNLTSDKELQTLVAKSTEWRTMVVEKVFVEYETGDKELAKEIMSKDVQEKAREIMSGFELYSEELKKEMKTDGERIAQQANFIKVLVITISIVAVLIGIFIAIFTANLIVNPIKIVVEKLQLIANGDLTGEKLKTKSKDELGILVNSLNDMTLQLRDLIDRIVRSSQQVAAASEELTASAEQSTKASELISEATQQAATGSEAQLKSVQEAASSIEQMSAGIQQASASSTEVSRIFENASRVSEVGMSTVEEVVTQMNDINSTVQELSAIINNLGLRSQEIGQIVGLITDISAQTNLLALNAAIEAARAGEHGKGFAVVADEVRKLAEQSSKSANQISDLITDIQKETGIAVKSMENGTEKVKNGLEKTYQVQESFKGIEGAVSSVTGNIQEISATMEQMAVGSQQIVHAIEVVKNAAEESAAVNENNSSATQEQLATMEEIAASANSLAQLAEELQDIITKFKL